MSTVPRRDGLPFYGTLSESERARHGRTRARSRCLKAKASIRARHDRHATLPNPEGVGGGTVDDEACSAAGPSAVSRDLSTRSLGLGSLARDGLYRSEVMSITTGPRGGRHTPSLSTAEERPRGNVPSNGPRSVGSVHRATSERRAATSTESRRPSRAWGQRRTEAGARPDSRGPVRRDRGSRRSGVETGCRGRARGRTWTNCGTTERGTPW